jgi:hypothetical protein
MQTDSSAEASLIEMLRRAVADAERRGYERGVKETMEKIQRLVLGGAAVATGSSEVVVADAASRDAVDTVVDDDADEVGAPADRKRAPKGLVRKVITRALSAGRGLSVQEIQATAQGDLEMMIQASSYRSELRKGRDSGLYREDSGRWNLAAKEKTEERPESTPSVFGSAAEGR